MEIKLAVMDTCSGRRVMDIRILKRIYIPGGVSTWIGNVATRSCAYLSGQRECVYDKTLLQVFHEEEQLIWIPSMILPRQRVAAFLNIALKLPRTISLSHSTDRIRFFQNSEKSSLVLSTESRVGECALIP